MLKRSIQAAVLWVVLAPPMQSEGLRVPVEVVRVYDGDTFTADAKPWPGVTMRVTVRLRGVDAPEIEGECEQERRLALKARDGLRSMLDGAGQVFLEQVKRGKYAGRVVARVIGPNGRNVADAMIQAGHGRPYQGGSRQGWCAEK